MRVPRLLKSFFPSPRSRLRWTDGLPLVLFLIVYAVTVLLLDAGKVLPERVSDSLPGWLLGVLRTCEIVLFTRPAAFWLMAVSVWLWWMSLNGYSGLNRFRSTVSLVIRLVLIGIFVALIAEPRAVRTNDTLSVVYALDISDSMGPKDEDEQHNPKRIAAAFVARTAEQKPAGDEAGLIVFGNNAAVELPPQKSFPLEGGMLVFNTRINPDSTNIEQALSLSAAMLPEENRGRIVLVTDGNETSGNLQQVLNDLKKREIRVDVLPFDYTVDEEVWVERIELPQFVKAGENYEASIVVSALQEGSGKLILEENSDEQPPIDIAYQAGKNRYDIPIYLREPGYYEYRVVIEADDGRDQVTQNNQAVGYIYVEGEGKVLLVTDPAGDPQDSESLEKAILEGERAVDVVDAYDFPDDPLSLMPYDCIVFCNAPHDAFDAIKLQALHDAVYNQGIGFLMVGGENSFGPGGYHRTVVEDLLPVSMDITKKKILPKGALAIILHTCEFDQGNTWGKRITQQAIKVLGEQDEVGVIVYGQNGEDWLFPLTPAGEYEDLVPVINSALIGDMPAFGPTMEIGLEGLVESDAATRHMIIISDGDPQAPTPQLMRKFVQEQVSVSTISIFPHGGNEIGLLRSIAGTTGGRYYSPADANQLPSIFIKEAKTLKRSMIQNEEIFPRAGFPSQILDGIEGVPSLQGYVLTSLKEDRPVEDILFTVPKDATEGETDPVLAVWQYGLGVTGAFTSDLSTNWGQNWVNWDHYQAFVKQLLIRISRVRKDGHLKMWSYASDNEGIIMIEDFHSDEMFLDVVAQVGGPREQTETVQLKQVGPRRYQASFPLWGAGRYQVMALGTGGDREERVHSGFIVSYSPEYINFRSNWPVLEQIYTTTGGRKLDIDTTSEEIFSPREPKQSSQPIFDWFLIALACLLPLDVAFRRVQLDWYTIKSVLGFDKRGESTQTMGALLARKKDVSQQFEKREEQPLQTLARTATYIREQQGRRTAAKKPTTPQAKKQAASSSPGESTTTSRLLEMKRKRQEDGEE